MRVVPVVVHELPVEVGMEANHIVRNGFQVVPVVSRVQCEASRKRDHHHEQHQPVKASHLTLLGLGAFLPPYGREEYSNGIRDRQRESDLPSLSPFAFSEARPVPMMNRSPATPTEYEE